MNTGTYQKRPDPVYYGECAVCHSIVSPKSTSLGKQEWFCHMCGGARHFCEHPECFSLHEVFYSKCEGDSHKKLLVMWVVPGPEEVGEWREVGEWPTTDTEEDIGTLNPWRLDPNGPVYR